VIVIDDLIAAPAGNRGRRGEAAAAPDGSGRVLAALASNHRPSPIFCGFQPKLLALDCRCARLLTF